MNKTNYILSYFAKYTFLLIVIISVLGFIIQFTDSIHIFNIEIRSIDIFTASATIISVVPYLIALLYIICNVYYKNIYNILLGLGLLVCMIMSFWIKH